jgi:predicted NBD/HSP70 family sugar kinase
VSLRVGPTQEEVRRQNLGALLRYVHLHGATSRAELTGALGLNRSTIGALTAELASAGLVEEAAPRETGRAGRPSPVVRPRSERVYAYALSIEADRLRAARIGIGAVVLDQREAPRPPDLPLEGTWPVLADLIAQLAGAVPAGAVQVGTGVAGCGLLRRANAPAHLRSGGQQAPGPESLRAELGVDSPVVVGNAADVCALAEHIRGAAVGDDNVIYLHRDVGVDAGIIVGGRRLTGAGGYAGAVGHMVVRPGGHLCGCGSRGCWETELGVPAPGTAGAGTASVVDAAASGDAAAAAMVRQFGDWLGLGVANLVNIFNPDMVIFGGALRDVYLAAAARVRSRLNATALPAARAQVKLRTPQLGADAVLIGAAELAFERLLADPLDAR